MRQADRPITRCGVVGSEVHTPTDEIERLSRSLKSLEPIRLHEEISRVTELSRLASTKIAEVVRVNQQHWQHMIDQTTAVSRMTDLPYIHRTWLRNLKSTQDQAAQLQIALKSPLGPIAARLAVSEHLFTGVDVAAICRSIALPELEILRLQDSINDMTTIYGKMAESIRTYPDITHLPRFRLAVALKGSLGVAAQLLPPLAQKRRMDLMSPRHGGDRGSRLDLPHRRP